MSLQERPSARTRTDEPATNGQAAAPWRRTTQYLLPARRPAEPDHYDIYPAFPLAPGSIEVGFDALAERIASHRAVTLDGDSGVLWEPFRQGLDAALARQGLRAVWVSVDEALPSQAELDALTAPFMGGDDPLFGTRFTGRIADFFDAARLSALQPDPSADLSIVYGSGAALAGWAGFLAYLEVPRNEQQFRSRAGSITNLGGYSSNPKEMYKRFYFVDWPALGAHKRELLSRLDLMVDAQRPDEPAFTSGAALRDGLARMARGVFRARPWFEPGPWGGQWIKERVPELNPDVPNYAWSFELISPENGLLFESDGLQLEVLFDDLMFLERDAVLGRAAERFGCEFPIRFDFLDTVRGGNLSLQCHPRPEFIREQFGESFTQDETYYILDCEPGATVYLGFQEGIDPAAFRAALERSYETACEVDVERFVQRHPASRHDLFLIPNGTIHCSGAGSLVLEISATPYIFTFKMYDWLRLDLEGRPRPLNIERAFANLYLERQGFRVQQELISHPYVLSDGPDGRVIHLPTHPAQFYDVHRLEFEGEMRVETGDGCHVLSLVEGASILVETPNGERRRVHYAETFIIPAAAGSYRLINESDGLARVIKAFIKPEALS